MTLAQRRARRLAWLPALLLLAAANASAMTPPPPPPKRFPFEGLLADAPGNLLLASAFDGLYRRSPGDARWQKSLDLPANAPIRLFDGGDAGWFVEIGVAWPRVEANLRAFRSTDAGAHWESVPPKAWIAAGDGHVFACDGPRLLASADRGATWHAAGRPPGRCREVFVASATLIYATTGNNDLARSEDAGAHWTRLTLPRDMPVIHLGPGGVLYAEGSVPETRPPELANGAFFAVSRSADHGATWQREWFGEREHVRGISIVAMNDRFVVAHASVMLHRPFRLCVREGARPCRWTETDYPGFSFALPRHADAMSFARDDGIWSRRVAVSGLLDRKVADYAGLPDEDSGAPRAH